MDILTPDYSVWEEHSRKLEVENEVMAAELDGVRLSLGNIPLMVGGSVVVMSKICVWCKSPTTFIGNIIERPLGITRQKVAQHCCLTRKRRIPTSEKIRSYFLNVLGHATLCPQNLRLQGPHHSRIAPQLEGDVVLRRLSGRPKPTLIFIGGVLNIKRLIPTHYVTNLWLKQLCDVSLQIAVIPAAVNL
jgi:hypothetical protein